MANTDFSRLFEKYLAGSITPEELIQLQRRIHDEEDRQTLEQLLGQAFANKQLAVTGDYTPEEMYQEFLGRIAAQNNQAPVIPLRRPRFRAAMAAAAVILIAVGIGTWYYINRPGIGITPVPSQPLAIHDVAPGGNKATLTLAGGQQVILDSAHTGNLTIQGSAQIVKTGAGHLSYQSMSNNNPATIIYNTLTTPRGGQYQLDLPDGTRVWLDAASSITYPTAFTGAERKVSITGQAYFEVRHDPKKPFSVSVRNTEIRDIGTAFNINAYSDEPVSAITLVEGAVSVRHGPAGKEVSLTRGQQALVLASGPIQVKPNADLDEVLAWKNGFFQFRSEDIASVLRQVSRWYDVEVENQTASPVGHITGKFPRNMNLSKVEKILELSGVHFTIQEHKIIIMP